MIERQSLSMLRLVEDIDSTLPTAIARKLPSWVPCFDRPTAGGGCVVNFFFDAAAGCTVDLSLLNDFKCPDVLSVKGVMLDTVRRSFPIMTGLVEHVPNLTVLERWRTEHLRKLPDPLWELALEGVSGSYRTGESYARALSLTLVAGSNYDDCNATKNPAHDANFAAFVRFAAKHNKSSAVRRLADLTKSASAGSTEQAKEYFAQLAHSSSRRNLLRTNQGLVGNGSKLVKKGDLICVLFGLDVPVILREDGSGYSFVDTCDVHGTMDGEAIKMLGNGELEARSFDLR